VKRINDMRKKDELDKKHTCMAHAHSALSPRQRNVLAAAIARAKELP
jgi:hypothetical protein